MRDEEMVELLVDLMPGGNISWTAGEIAADLLPAVRRIAAMELRDAAELADTWSRLSPPGDRSDAYAHVHDVFVARATDLDHP